MNALVDYGSSSNESDSDSEEEVKSNKDDTKEAEKPKLPKPTLGENSLQTSVFSNPFVEAELAKAAILEKHVKMAMTVKVPGKGNVQVINGKKICWNFRKGRCRFGHNCKYAHDSDIQKTAEELEAEKQKLKTVVCEGSGTMTCSVPPIVEEIVNPTDDSVWESNTKKKKKRPGLSSGLVPSQKVIKMYKEQKLKDAVSK